MSQLKCFNQKFTVFQQYVNLFQLLALQVILCSTGTKIFIVSFKIIYLAFTEIQIKIIHSKYLASNTNCMSPVLRGTSQDLLKENFNNVSFLGANLTNLQRD